MDIYCTIFITPNAFNVNFLLSEYQLTFTEIIVIDDVSQILFKIIIIVFDAIFCCLNKANFFLIHNSILLYFINACKGKYNFWNNQMNYII